MRTEEEERRDDARARRLLAGLPAAAPGATQRVRARLLAGARPAPSRLRLVGVAVGTALATAAALLLVQRAVVPTPAAPPPVSVAVSLDGDGWTTVAPAPNVFLSYAGAGAVAGTSDAPVIRWDSGTLNVEVTPDRGIRLSVETRDAVVRVVGTGFTVRRDVLGTRVEVRHGRVEVDCGDELTRVLEVGDDVGCLPRSAAGLLGRARALQAAGGAPAEVLATIDRGLAVADTPAAIADELAASRVRVLYDVGRHAEALASARTYLERHGGARRSEVEALAANAAVALGGCATAAPWLAQLAPAACAR